MSGSGVGTIITTPVEESQILAQVYCTARQVQDDLKLKGFEDRADLMDRIKAASDAIQREVKGNFIPILETKNFGDESGKNPLKLFIPALLSLSSIVNDDTTLSTDDYLLKPLNRMWEHGPYICIESESRWADEDGIEISGSWGLYDHTKSLGITATQATASETTLVVSNGSQVSPGMVVLIEREQEYVEAGAGGTGSPAGTSATSKLNGAAGETDDTLTVDNGAEFNAGEVIQVDVEDLYIQKIGGNVLSVIRGWNGTVPAAHLDDAAIRVYRTFAVVRGVNGTSAAIHTAKTVYQYLVPETVNYLCRQIACLMRMKAETGFSGVTGNSEMGTARYFSEFPPNQIREVLDPFNTGEM